MIDSSFIKARFGAGKEDWGDIIERVAQNGSSAEISAADIRELLRTGIFVPSGQILRKIGLEGSLLYSCYVTEADNNETSIDIANRITSWTKLGTGVGINPSEWIRNRPKPNPDSIQEIFDAVGCSQESLWEKGINRTATMINLDFDLDGIVEISSQLHKKTHLRHLNIGVVIDDSQMIQAEYEFRNDPKGCNVSKLKAIAKNNWETGNPGIIFKGRVNADHLFQKQIIACNPCAEQHLEPNEGCNLSSLNLSKFVREDKFDFELFRDASLKATYFLDNIIDITSFPNDEAERIAKGRRRIGLGVQGFGSMLEGLGLEYGSEKSLLLSLEISSTLKESSMRASEYLAAKYGRFDHWNELRVKSGIEPRRNSHLLSLAPTGSTSMIWQVSSGIEPIFSSQILKGEYGVVLRRSTPLKSKNAYEISPQNQVSILNAWQRNIDGGISKTVNVKEDCNWAEILEIYFHSWSIGCKSVSVYRHNSREKNAFTSVR